MDLISRIKAYIEHAGLTRSQFADSCGIPRPTLTQLLNGHNKKVSDDILSKIHDAYPDLSMMWLVFGEGEMILHGNIGISKAENSEKQTPSTTQQADTQNNYALFDIENNTIDFDSEKSANPQTPLLRFHHFPVSRWKLPLHPVRENGKAHHGVLHRQQLRNVHTGKRPHSDFIQALKTTKSATEFSSSSISVALVFYHETIIILI